MLRVIPGRSALSVLGRVVMDQISGTYGIFEVVVLCYVVLCCVVLCCVVLCDLV